MKLALVIATVLAPLTAVANPCEVPALIAIDSARVARRATFTEAKLANLARLQSIALRYRTRPHPLAEADPPPPAAPALHRPRSSKIGRVCWPVGIAATTARSCTCECP